MPEMVGRFWRSWLISWLSLSPGEVLMKNPGWEDLADGWQIIGYPLNIVWCERSQKSFWDLKLNLSAPIREVYHLNLGWLCWLWNRMTSDGSCDFVCDFGLPWIAHCLDLPTCALSTWSTQLKLENAAQKRLYTNWLRGSYITVGGTVCVSTKSPRRHKRCHLPTSQSVLNLICILGFSLPSHFSVVIICHYHLSAYFQLQPSIVLCISD